MQILKRALYLVVLIRSLWIFRQLDYPFLGGLDLHTKTTNWLPLDSLTSIMYSVDVHAVQSLIWLCGFSALYLLLIHPLVILLGRKEEVDYRWLLIGLVCLSVIERIIYADQITSVFASAYFLLRLRFHYSLHYDLLLLAFVGIIAFLKAYRVGQRNLSENVFGLMLSIIKQIYSVSKKLLNMLNRTKTKQRRVIVDQKIKKEVKSKDVPDTSLLQRPLHNKMMDWDREQRQAQLKQVLQEFGVRGEIISTSVGPVVTLYELQPEPGVKAQRIIGLADDIARSMSALSARIAPIPGKDVIGIELSNPQRDIVYLSEVLESRSYQHASGLALALGADIGGRPVIADLSQMPHMLMAGTTGSGKSVVVHSLLLSILFKHTPETCKLILIDPKMLELSIYEDIPHLLTPVVTDPKKASFALRWAVQEMEHRYKIMSKAGVRNLAEYNAKMSSKLPYIVVVVDEFADLMMVAGKEVDMSIQRLAQMARAAGIHVILATQRPSVDVITGTIKANFPTRIALQVASRIDGRTILGDYGGAEQLLGKGDMLYLHGAKVRRVHGPFVTTEEVEAVVKFWKAQSAPNYAEIALEEDAGLDTDDEMLEKIWEFLKRTNKLSVSALQREFSIGFNKAARYMEILEKMNRVSPPDNAGRRKLL